VKPDVESSIDEYLAKTRSVTQYDLANRFGVRLSVARRILRQKESDGLLVPYIREGGLEVYTTPVELEKRKSEAPIMIADALEEVASSVPKSAIITEEMDAELIAASSAGTVVKPSRLARQRREAGEKKEKSKAKLPEVIVEPLAQEPVVERAAATLKPESEPKATPKKTTKKKAEEKAKPEKKTTKKTEDKTKPKKTTKKKAEEKAKPEKKTTKKTEDKTKPKKTTKKADAKPKKTTKKKAA